MSDAPMSDAPMAGERRQQIEVNLDQVLELSPEDSDAYLDLACAADPALRAEVIRLLDEKASSTTHAEARTPAANMAVASLLGQAFGLYQLYGLIGVGGMGAVYEASTRSMPKTPTSCFC